MKLGQVMSFLDVGLVPEEHREEFQRKLGALRDAAPKVRFSDMRKVIESELEEPLKRELRRVRRGADRGRLDRPGLPRAAARRPRRRGQGPVPRRRRRGPGGHAEPRDDPAADEADRARPGRQEHGRGDPLADLRRARLRARGAEPARARADLQGPPVHRRPRRRHEPLAREGDGLRVRRRRRLRHRQGGRPGHARPRRRDRLPLLLRLHVPPPAVQRRPAPGQLPAAGRRPRRVPGLRPVQGHAAQPDRARARDPARRPRGRRAAAVGDLGRGRAAAASPTSSARTSCSRSSWTPPGGT